MAKAHAPANSDTAERAQVALEATWQIAGLFDALIAQGVELEHADTLQEAAVIRALAIRGKRLTSAAMSMLGDDSASLDEERQVVIDGSEAPDQEEIGNG